MTKLDLSRLTPQAAYLVALAAYQIEQEKRNAVLAPLNAARKAGSLNAVDYAQAVDALPEMQGTDYIDAWSTYYDALDNLMIWGLQQVRQSWTKHAKRFPKSGLTEIEQLFEEAHAQPVIREKLVALILKLDVAA